MNGFCVILYILSFINLSKIYTTNQAKKRAEKNYATHSYKKSASYLHTLIDSLQIKDDNAIIDLAHTYYQIRDNKKAENYYSKSANSSNPKIKSIASHQLGILAYNEKQNEKALAYFKSALQADPTNEKARYNYELLKKENEQNKSEKKEDKNKEQENKDNSNNKDKNKKEQNQSSKNDQGKNKKEDQNNAASKEKKDKKQDKEKQEESAKNNKQEDKKDKQNNTENKSEKENNEKEKKELSKQLQQLNLTEEKATSILDAMKNNETQYLQQKRKQMKESAPDNRPTW